MKACVSHNSFSGKINFVCSVSSGLVLGTDTAATWDFNDSEIRALKTIRSRVQTNQSSIKPNNRGPRNWFTANYRCRSLILIDEKQGFDPSRAIKQVRRR